jgi:UDP-N-acetylmuramyl tripeptide synthase
VIGGHAILAIEPRALARLSAGRQVVLVSGTNGKTTTTKLLTRALAATTGGEVVTNVAGANLPTGLAAALARGTRGAPAVLEVDEAWLARVAAQVEPAAMLLLNLSRDQLDRNNEVRHVAQRWRHACEELPDGAAVVANADDPLVAWAAGAARQVVWVGAGLSWKNDATGCPACGGPVAFDAVAWECRGCGFAKPNPQIWLDRTVAGGAAVVASGARHDLHLPLPGRCNQANAVTVLAALNLLRLPGAQGSHPPDSDELMSAAITAMGEVREVAGRYAMLDVGTDVARLLLAKNPAGWAEVFDMLSSPPGPVVVAINARTADGHDPSWLWDVPFELLAGRPVVATGERYRDLAVRLQYAGVAHTSEPDLRAAVGRAAGLASSGSQCVGPPSQVVDVVANYTAFHQLLAQLRSRAEGPSS